MLPKVIEFAVTQEDIDCGIRDDSECCPVAKSLLKSYPDSEPLVHNNYILLNDNDEFRHYYASEAVKNFIKNFDNELEAKPFVGRITARV